MILCFGKSFIFFSKPPFNICTIIIHIPPTPPSQQQIRVLRHVVDIPSHRIEQLKTGGTVSYTDAKSVADKRLIRLSWFYDINFDWTLRLLVAEGHLDKQLATLPDNQDTRIIKATVKKYIAHRLKA